LPPALSNNSSTSIANTYPTYNTNPFPLKKNTNPLLNVPRVAQATNCENENTENSVGTVAKKGNPIGEITKATTYSGLVTRAKRSLGNVKMTNTPLLNIAKMATASGLVRRNNPGVV